MNNTPSCTTSTTFSAANAIIRKFFAAGDHRPVREIIMHCSATPRGRNVKTDEIRRWHTQERRRTDIGYHFVVELDGSIRPGRDLRLAGAHTRGRNAASIGICYVGGTEADGSPADTRTDPQRAALKALVNAIRREAGPLPVFGHRDFAPKACPCFDAAAEFRL